MGIGVRVASRMLSQRVRERDLERRANATSRRSPAAGASAAAGAGPYVKPARRLGRGARGFGQAVFRPLAHIGGTLWLEITGLFFTLFAIFFAQNAFHLRRAFHGGPERAHFFLYLALTALFAYFSATSFARARRRAKKGAR